MTIMDMGMVMDISMVSVVLYFIVFGVVWCHDRICFQSMQKCTVGFLLCCFCFHPAISFILFFHRF